MDGRIANPGDGARTRLAGGRFVDVERGRFHPPGVSVVVQDGRILAMPGLPGQPDPPVERSVDLHGMTVIPGLFNTHLHLQLVNPALFVSWSDIVAVRRLRAAQIRRNLDDCLRHGITRVRDGWCPDLRRNRRLREAVGAGHLAGPRIAQAVVVGPVGGAATPRRTLPTRMGAAAIGFASPAYEDPAAGEVGFRPDATAREVRDAVDRAVDERGAEAIKLYDQRERIGSYAPGATVMTQAQLDAAADQARLRGVPTVLHQATLDAFRRGVRAGVLSLVHVPCDGPLTGGDTAAFVGAGCILEPTLSLAYDLDWEIPGIPCADPDRLRRLDAFRQGTVRGLAERFWEPALRDAVIRGCARAGRGGTRILGLVELAGALRFYSGVVSHGMDNVNQLRANGAMIACGNDAGAVARTPAMIGLELALAGFCRAEAGAGWTGAEALRAATVDSARAMGIADRAGTIEPGKVADLAVVRGDPLADPEVVGSPVEALFLDGRLVVDTGGLRIDPGSDTPGSSAC